MDSKRPRPYVWPTWVAGVLAGTSKCRWAAWFKAHYRYEKRPDAGGDLGAWTKQHDAMVAETASRLKSAGYLVRVEDEASFKLEGSGGTLAGKPDIVAVPADLDALPVMVVDEKSGTKKPKDAWQVLVYLIALPLTWLPRGCRLEGYVEYRDGLSQVSGSCLVPGHAHGSRTPASPVLDCEREAFGEVMRSVTGDLEPPRAPSAAECRYCDIASCPDRVEVAERTGGAGGLF